MVSPWAVAQAPLRVQAVQAGPLQHATGPVETDHPPAQGWTEVRLPDMWSTRWPDFDGVVWYRLQWRQADAGAPVALAMDYLNMAGAIYLNGSMLLSDTSLVEPLSRAWNLPRYLVLPAALVHAGENTIDIRISGHARYQAGLGRVDIGTPAEVWPLYGRAYWLRVQSQWFCLAVSVSLGCFFLALWLMRRQASVYGWFALMSLAWWACSYNQMAYDIWPFPSSDAWERVNTISLLLFNAAFAMFILRFCERHWRRYEVMVWCAAGGAMLALCLVTGERLSGLRALFTGLQTLHYIAVALVFVIYACRRGRGDHRLLAVFLAVAIAAAIHDTLAFVGVVTDNLYLAPLSVLAQMICMALVLGWRFVDNLRRIEGFNQDLTRGIELARGELRQTLARQHELEIANARLGARQTLAQDLHDGLGGTLVSSIVMLERTPQDMPPQRFLGVLKELRDDLRIIIDSATSQQYGITSLEGQMSPLRHRMSQQFEAHGIECAWQLSGLDTCILPAASSLELMRLLQEALANVQRHSQATRVEVELRHEAGRLALEVRDNGIGFSEHSDQPRFGTGLHNMRARAGRLGGTLEIRSEPGATRVTMRVDRI